MAGSILRIGPSGEGEITVTGDYIKREGEDGAENTADRNIPPAPTPRGIMGTSLFFGGQMRRLTFMAILAVLIISVIMVVGQSEAAYLDGHQLSDGLEKQKAIRKMLDTKGPLPSPMVMSDGMRVVGYILGIRDLLSDQLCQPPSVEAKQLYEVVDIYLKSHPTDLDHNAADLVAGALIQNFRCPGK